MHKNKIHFLFLFSSFLFILGLFLSKFLLSIGIFAVLFSSVFSVVVNGFPPHRPLVLIGNLVIFFLVLISGIYVENIEAQKGLLVVMSPFIILPLSFYCIDLKGTKYFYYILYMTVFIGFFSSCYVFINYLFHFDAYQQDLSVSKAIPTPHKDHIRFSMMLIVSIISAVELLRKSFYLRSRHEKYVLWLLLILQVIFLHVFAVRTGLLAFYLILFLGIVHLIRQHRKWALGLVLAALLLPVFAFYTLPSVRQKFYLMRYNYQQYMKGDLAQLSDTQRILSYRVAFDLFQEQMWTGVGMGDLYQEQEKKFRHLYPEANVMQPHNQFLSFLAGTGLFGFLLFCFAFIFPLFYRHSWKNIWLASFYLLFIISLFTEDTFFVSLGLSIYLFYQLSFLKFNTIE